MMRRTLALAAVLFLAATPAAAQEQILLANVSFPREIAEWFEQESARLEKLCRARDCWARELQRKTWVLNRAHSSPDSNAPYVGDVLAVSAHTDGWPHLRIDYRPLGGGPQAVWLDADEIGDWGYGIYVVVRATGQPSQG